MITPENLALFWFGTGFVNVLLVFIFEFKDKSLSEIISIITFWNSLGILFLVVLGIVMGVIGIFFLLSQEPEIYTETFYNTKFLKFLIYFSPILSLGLLWLME